MRGSVHLIVALGAAFAPAFAHAHFLWASLDGTTKTVAIGLQEVPTDAPLPLAERAGLIKAWTASEKTLALKPEGNWLKSLTTDHCVGVSLDYGVLDKRDQNRGVFWLRYYAKAADSPATSQTKVGLPVEVTFSVLDETRFLVTVLKDGKPTAGADVVIASSKEGADPIEGKTGADGTLAFDAQGGPLAIRALVTDNVKGKHDGKSYDLVRSYCSLTVPMPVVAKVEAPKAAGTEAPKPFTRRLSEAFGNNHDVVGDTAFVETLMGGNLTKPQWEAHLQQRALIHEEIDRILAAAGTAAYGDEQRKVTELLRQDLTALGSKWPDAATAWPLTNDLLRQIRESAQQGPYFALGVWHVYYGGITHGGRQIGAIAAKAVKAEPSYYLKSDGYRAYATKVNEITDPAAQQQMILGGQAAYKYIIASNDAEIFKKK
ncbi:hypothetical protein EON81_13510 [bacterium]|nr:MAG: hypothetical protein EON81_13510 [bacterium]